MNSLKKHLPKLLFTFLKYSVTYGTLTLSLNLGQLVLPFLKPNENLFLIHSSRPISLTSDIYKIFVKIINNMLLWTLEKHHRLVQSLSATFESLLYHFSYKSVVQQQETISFLSFTMLTKYTVWKYKIIAILTFVERSMRCYF